MYYGESTSKHACVMTSCVVYLSDRLQNGYHWCGVECTSRCKTSKKFDIDALSVLRQCILLYCYKTVHYFTCK
jgi:hypothetical protein